MHGKHVREQDRYEPGTLVRSALKRVGTGVACTGISALMMGQMLMPSMALADNSADEASAQSGAVAAAAASDDGASSGGDNEVAASKAAEQPASSSKSKDGAATGTQKSQESSQSDAQMPATSVGASMDASALEASSAAAPASEGDADTNAGTLPPGDIATYGVTDTTKPGGVIVNTTVNSHYSECWLPSNITLVKGQPYTFDFPDMEGGMPEKPYAEIEETKYYRADAASGALTEVQDASKSDVTIHTEPVDNHIRATLTFTGGASSGSYSLTRNDDVIVGSKLTYTSTDYNGSDITIGDPDDVFGASQAGGQVTINEIRDDYCLRYRFNSTVKLVAQAEPISNAALAVYHNFRDGDAPSTCANVSSFADYDKYEIADEYWEEMDANSNPVKFWHSNEAENAKVPESQRLTKFEQGKRYLYSVTLRQKNGYEFADNCTVAVNGAPLNAANVTKTSTGVFLTAVSQFTCDKALVWQAIDTVEINGATVSFKAGEKPRFTGTTPDGADYWYQCEFWDSEDGASVNSAKFWDQNITNHIDEFEAGKTYKYGFYLKAYEGFYFTHDTKVNINGTAYNFKWLAEDEDNLNQSGQTSTMWVYTDLAMTPEATTAPTDPEKPGSNPGDNGGATGGNGGGTDNGGTTGGSGSDDDNTAGSNGSGDNGADSATRATNDTSASEAVKKASDDSADDSSEAEALPATGDGGMLAGGALGMGAAALAAAGAVAAKRRRN